MTNSVDFTPGDTVKVTADIVDNRKDRGRKILFPAGALLEVRGVEKWDDYALLRVDLPSGNGLITVWDNQITKV